MYKWVEWRSGRLESCMVEGPASVVYTPNEWAVAPEEFASHGYHLLVFGTLEDAREFYAAPPDVVMQLWECEVEDVVDLPPTLDYWDISVHGYAPEFEANLSWPTGTIMVKRVKLTKKVP